MDFIIIEEDLRVTNERGEIVMDRLINLFCIPKSDAKLAEINRVIDLFSSRPKELDKFILYLCTEKTSAIHSLIYYCEWQEMLQAIMGPNNKRKEAILFTRNDAGFCYVDAMILGCNFNMTKYLVENLGIAETYRNDYNDNILHLSAKNNDPEIFFYLLEKYPHFLFAQNQYGITAAHNFIISSIARYDHANLSEFFAKDIIKSNIQDIRNLQMGDVVNRTILHFAAGKFSRSTRNLGAEQQDIDKTLEVLTRNLLPLLKISSAENLTPLGQSGN